MSDLEDAFAFQLRALGVPPYERELAFFSGRRWRFDFAWPQLMLAVEIEGGTWSGGRHTTGSGFESDAWKYGLATLVGWRVIRLTGAMVEDGRGISLVDEFFSSAENEADLAGRHAAAVALDKKAKGRV